MNTGVPIDKLKSIMGHQELKHLLKTQFKPENFCVENTKDGTFCINLHIHTVYSDGVFTPEELLDQAAKYAEHRLNLGKTDPVIIAITDHDTISGTIEAIEIIADNPKKYENIRFVPGIEFNTFYQLENNARKQLEVLAYCINPYKIEKFVKNIQEQNLKYIEQFVPDENIRKQTKYLKIAGSPALMSEVREVLGGLNPNIIEEHRQSYGHLSINPGSPTLQEVTQTIKDSGYGFISIAHPGRSLNGYDLRTLFTYFKEEGIEAVEANYHYIPHDGVSTELQDHIRQLADQTNMLKTGGIDCHTDSLFIGRL